ncbi:hypothetical protein [Altererythrobacter lauratis]|uniref:Uncharacterized protein n=1 Tax=Alteraurantiacibacter lauratis TaxID=2054627 RepID=A0ABV7EET2_9SPHN
MTVSDVKRCLEQCLATLDREGRWTAGAHLSSALYALERDDGPDTKAYVPILATGIVGGAMIGWGAGRFAT